MHEEKKAQREREVVDGESAVGNQVAANIERYLDNHTRDGGHAWQMNMAARRPTWHPIEDPTSASITGTVAGSASDS